MKSVVERVDMFKRRPTAEPSRAERGSAWLRSDATFASVDDPLAVLAVLAGFVLVILSLPSDVVPRDALRVPALLFTMSLCLVPGIAALRDAKSIFRAEHILVMAPVYWLLLDPLQGRFEMVGVRPEDVERAFGAIAVFIAGAWIAFNHRPWQMPDLVRSTTRAELPPQFYFSIGVLAFSLAFLKYALPVGFDFTAMARALSGGRWEGAWARGALGGTDAFLDHLSYFGYLLPPLTVVLGRRVGWGDRRTCVLAISTAIMSGFLLQGGGRRLVGIFFGSGGVAWFLGRQKVRLTVLLGLVLLVFVLLITMERMFQYRTVGMMAMFDAQRTPDPEIDDAGVLVHVDDNFLRLAQTTAIFPDLHPYTTWRYVVWVASRPVPRLLWPGKPVDPGFDLSQFLGFKGASLSSSVVGELFMAGGFMAVALGGWLYGSLARSLWHFLSQVNTWGALTIYSVGLLAIFVGVRSMIELVLTSYVMLAWIVLVRIYDGFHSKNN